MNDTVDGKHVAKLVEQYFDRMSKTDKNHILAAIIRVERKLLLAGLKPVKPSEN